jgi:surface carbohydrate biosynthesis protein
MVGDRERHGVNAGSRSAMSNVFFPIETVTRELDYRLFLATLCANGRNRIFVGQHETIYRLAQHTRGGVYVGKHIFRSEFPQEKTERYRAIKASDFRLVHLDEEGAVYCGGPPEWEGELRRRLDAKCLAPDDQLCTWGDFQREFYKAEGARAPVLTTGHPRFDLYRQVYRDYYAEDVARIATQYSPFVLINTNVAGANNSLGLADTFSERLHYNPTNKASRTYHFGMWAYLSRVLVSFIELVNTLSLRFPTTNFVVRPHPAEDADFYRTIFRGIRNVHVEKRGSVTAWLFACTALIQEGCTTGIEAFLAGRNVVNYKMLESPRHELFLPNQFGARCSDEKAVIAALEPLLTKREPITRNGAASREALSLMLNFDASHDSFKSVAEVINAVGDDIPESKRRLDERGFARTNLLARASSTARRFVRPMFPERQKAYQALLAMFPGFTQADIAHRMARVQSVLKKRVHWTFHDSELISIEASR